MKYPKDFFALQISFAQKVAEVRNISLEDALLLNTGFYKYFNIDNWDFDQNNPIWQEYLSLIQNCDDMVGKSYQFYLDRNSISKEPQHPSFGCFSYEYEKDDNAVQIHF